MVLSRYTFIFLFVMPLYDDIQKDEEESLGEEEEKKSDEEEPGQDVDWSAEDFESEENE